MVIVFGALALAVLVTGNWYLWRRLFRDTTRGPGWARRAGAVLIGAGWTLAITGLVAERTGAPFWLQRVLAWPGFLWLAVAMYLLLAVLAGEAVRPLLRLFLERRAARRATDAAPEPLKAPQEPVRTLSEVPASPDATKAPEVAQAPSAPEGTAGTPETATPAGPTRRLFVSRVVAGAAATAAVGTVGYGTYGVLRGPKVKRVTVPLAKLPRAAHGYRIAVVSDIHLSPILGRGFAQKVVDTINGTQPDLIAVVGDLVDGSVKDLGPAAAPLAQLTARQGKFFVTGNHEYFSGAEQWVEEVRRLGIRPLQNERTELPWFDLAGVNDIAGESEGQGPDFAKALGDRDTARTAVLLAHQPVQIHDAVDHGVDLQLSGHTHGGQLWPGKYFAEAANPTVSGLERYDDTQLYVSNGAGAWGPPTRVGAPSDVTVIELASLRA
ncbi:metallophosphoesterase [Streptomyces acidiscabies]|uniref:Metallophosphoesterase n=1 Tax=Streptomyces acidiscabies TaxID=42234 RepID=A0AAP6BFU0_9ACTN|nr:metallophosphoesterase [Streptomyces acidiscabies]MBP5937416.1 metallophosphoesterase [Streptomyces sp. LBUM 1476]MBZ3914513.1 metallophosphoesterase [Streptomyces acidiscabies]MDX2963850.1 metallophosphoesterase [Streptomyces acidiscabies]MDX3017202.1 metallophosphoesterase [Streptomyces acidiscabies]MDX3789153.1 metallophosphoesterase [Streptomyces acidiscabies]